VVCVRPNRLSPHSVGPLPNVNQLMAAARSFSEIPKVRLLRARLFIVLLAFGISWQCLTFLRAHLTVVKTLPDGAIASVVAIPEAAANPSVATSVSMLRSWTSEAGHNLDEVIELTLL
jgi:hypothetical protein